MTLRWPALLAFALALAAAVAATWAAATSPTDTLLCNFVHPDCLSNHWLLVWVAEQSANGASILHNDRYYWPVGDAPWLAGNGSEGFAYLPFHLLLGWPLGSTVYLVGILALNGFASYTLARSAGASALGSLAAAPTGAILLYAIHELGAGRFSQVSVCWLAFFFAAWLRFLTRPTHLGAGLAAGLLTVSSLFYWYYGLFGVLGGAVLLGTWLPVKGLREPGAHRRRLVTLATFAASYLLLIAPLLFVYLRYWASIPGTGEDQFPHPESIGDSTFPGVPFLVSGGRHAGRALPLSTCILAFIALYTPTRRRTVIALWALVLLFAALMAGALFPFGPYELIYGIAGPLRRFWWPYRHVVGMNLGLIALAAIGADTAGAWIARRKPALARHGPLAAGLLALSIPLQLTAQGAPWNAQFSKIDLTDPFYPALQHAPGTLIAEPPFAPEVASAQTPLIYQLQHRKTLLSGHALWVERVRPRAWDEMVANNSFLTQLQAMERGEMGDRFTFTGADLQALVDAGARTWVVNQEYFPAQLKPLVIRYDALFDALFGEPFERGKRVKAWDAGEWSGRTEVTLPPFTWPPTMRFGGPTLALQAPRPPSIAFSIPAPPKAPKPKQVQKAPPAKSTEKSTEKEAPKPEPR